MAKLHEEHLGMFRIKSLARRYLWWPNLDGDIKESVEKSPSCMSVRNSPKSAPLHPWILATRPLQRIHIYYADYKGQYLLTVYDSYSKWLEAFPVKSMTSSMTIGRLRLIFATTGLPEEIVSDNGPQFTSSEFKEFTRMNGIKHHTTHNQTALWKEVRRSSRRRWNVKMWMGSNITWNIN
jgi:hypothetical protein